MGVFEHVGGWLDSFARCSWHIAAQGFYEGHWRVSGMDLEGSSEWSLVGRCALFRRIFGRAGAVVLGEVVGVGRGGAFCWEEVWARKIKLFKF